MIEWYLMNTPIINEMKDLYLAGLKLLKQIHKEEDQNKINDLMTYWLTSSQALDYCIEYFVSLDEKDQDAYLIEFEESINTLNNVDEEITKYTKQYKKENLPKA